ncbi:hypothetical protein FOA52_010447 [Chlamydomonas sp. UWO 241]|nr:hypothetical protein FOA52_010447 [Chlamydomonas sp. UWO 241]
MDPLAMLMFSRDNKASEITAAIAAGAPPDSSNQMGQTGLHIAALWGSHDAAEALLKGGANVNVENMQGQTPLHFGAAARKNPKEMCTLLLAHGAATDVMDAVGRYAFELADDDEIRTMLGGPDGRLFEYAAAGNVEELQELLAGGAIKSLKLMDSQGRTAVNIAASEGKIGMVKALLAHDPTCLDLPDSGGDLPLHCATEAGHADMVSYLLTLNPNIDYQNLNPSEYAGGNWLLGSNPIEPLDKTALHIAVDQGDAEIAGLLLDAGADVNKVDFDKRQPLHLALEMQDDTLIELLIKNGADVNKVCPDFGSPLHLAAKRGPLKTLKLLLESGADATVLNEEGWAPLHLAARAGNADKVSALASAAPLLVSAPNAHGNCALHLASLNGHAPAVAALIAAGADAGVKNKEGMTAGEVTKNADVRAALQK